MWTKVAAVLLLAAVLVLAVAGTRGTSVHRAVARGPSETELLLDRPIPEVHLGQVPLDEAVETLRRLSGANIVLDVKTLRAEGRGIDRRDRTEPLDLRGTTLGGVLRLVLPMFDRPACAISFTLT